MLSLEAYLYDGSFCIRSVMDGVLPLFELEDRYDSANGDLVDLLEKSELCDRFRGFFQGFRVSDGVVCEITDCRRGGNRVKVVCLEQLRDEDREFGFLPSAREEPDYFSGFVD